MGQAGRDRRRPQVGDDVGGGRDARVACCTRRRTSSTTTLPRRTIWNASTTTSGQRVQPADQGVVVPAVGVERDAFDGRQPSSRSPGHSATAAPARPLTTSMSRRPPGRAFRWCGRVVDQRLAVVDHSTHDRVPPDPEVPRDGGDGMAVFAEPCDTRACGRVRSWSSAAAAPGVVRSTTRLGTPVRDTARGACATATAPAGKTRSHHAPRRWAGPCCARGHRRSGTRRGRSWSRPSARAHRRRGVPPHPHAVDSEHDNSS